MIESCSFLDNTKTLLECKSSLFYYSEENNNSMELIETNKKRNLNTDESVFMDETKEEHAPPTKKGKFM